jgi:hypothetical protein
MAFVLQQSLLMPADPSLKGSVGCLLVAFLGVAFHCLMNLAVAFVTETLQVVIPEGESLHFIETLCAFDGYLVVDRLGWHYLTVGQTQLAERVRASLLVAQQSPLSAVVDPLLVLRLLGVLHITSSIHSLTNSRISSNEMGS